MRAFRIRRSGPILGASFIGIGCGPLHASTVKESARLTGSAGAGDEAGDEAWDDNAQSQSDSMPSWHSFDLASAWSAGSSARIA